MHHRFQIDKQIYFDMLEQLQKTLQAIVVDEGKIPEEVIEPMVEQWISIINDSYQELFDLTNSKINKYLNIYHVKPENQSDEFKYIYFSGMVIAEKLKEAGMVDYLKYHLRAVLRILDYRLKRPYNAQRPELSQRIEKAIENHQITEHFGEYGWYLLYKCLYNSAQDAAKAKIKNEVD